MREGKVTKATKEVAVPKTLEEALAKSYQSIGGGSVDTEDLKMDVGGTVLQKSGMPDLYVPYVALYVYGTPRECREDEEILADGFGHWFVSGAFPRSHSPFLAEALEKRAVELRAKAAASGR